MGRDSTRETLMRLTAIDIGTNTILMLIADISRDGEILVVRDEHVIARLGKGVDENRKILPETFQRVLKILSEYKRIHDETHSSEIIACGTSALRDASNRDEFTEFIRNNLGFSIEILGGDEEAELTYLGGVSEFIPLSAGQHYAVLDIGGGSTEFTFGKDAVVTSKVSMDIGSVRLTERFLKTSPPDPSGIEHAQRFVNEHSKNLEALEDGTRCIGVAGTLTTLAAIDLQLAVYDRVRVSGHVLALDTIQRIFEMLKKKRLEEIKAIPQILPQRADIILAGILILLELMKKVGVGSITASDRGLRYGILLREARQRE